MVKEGTGSDSWFLQRGVLQESRMHAGSGGCGTAAAAPGWALRSGLRTMLAWGVLVLMAGRGGVEACPAPCSCQGNTVDCHGLGIHAVPRNIPRGTERLDLNGNNLTVITKTDFSGLKHLRVLHLMENQISNVERGAFDELKELERLRLNKNHLSQLPELLFQKNEGLSRLLGYVDSMGASVNHPRTTANISEDQFLCPCCYEILLNPTTLTCGHTFCRHCLALWWEASHSNQCPVCRQRWQGFPQINILLRDTTENLLSRGEQRSG